MHPILLNAFDDQLSFGSPEWFWAMLLLIPIMWVFIIAGRRREAMLSRILAPRLQASLSGQVSLFKRNLRTALLLLAIALSFVALAQPRYGVVDQEIKSRGRDVIIAIDTSRSMLSTDTAPTRLGRAKLISQDLLNLLRGDRVGLIAFAGTAFLQAPLTLDKGAVLTSIDDLDTKTIPKGGTDLASAIRLAIPAFGKGETMSRALILMTDGEELEESGVEAAKEAAAAGIRIFTIGFGSASGSLIPIKTDDGQNDFVRDETGRPVNSKLDAPRLTEIAKETGGFYLPYGQDAASIIYEKGIVPMEQEETGTLSARKPIERYAWPATAALILLAFWSILGEGRRRRASAALSGLVAVFFGLAPCSVHADASGISAYQQGNYQGALTDFEKRLQSGANTPEIRFDAGAAAYKAGDYKKAAEYFAEAMTSTNPKIREAATYNLANSLVRSGEAAPEKEGKISDWKNALQHYETVLKETPSNSQAKENRDIVRKLIEDINKQPPPKKQDKKKNQDQKDQNKDKNKNDQSQGGGGQKDQKDQNKDQNKNDQSQGGGGQKDQKDNAQNQPQKDQADQNKPQDSKGSQGGNQGEPTPPPSPTKGNGTDANNQSSQQQKNEGSPQQKENSPKNPNQENPGHGVQPTPTPSQNQQISSGGAKQGDKNDQQTANGEEAKEAEEGKDGKMTPNQARALLHSVQDEEAHQLSNQQNRAVEQPLRDW
jgi:Ca-activated chloride channel family protein